MLVKERFLRKVVLYPIRSRKEKDKNGQRWRLKRSRESRELDGRVKTIGFIAPEQATCQKGSTYKFT